MRSVRRGEVMRKILFLLLFLMLGVSLFAVSMDALSSSEMAEFNRSRLSFETKAGTYGYFGDHGFWGEISYKYWVGYQGFNPVSEADYFEIAGYEKEAKEARTYQNATRDLLWGGIAAVIIGGALYFTSDSSSTREVGGVIIASGGSLALTLGLIRMTTNRYPSNIAQSVADDFNARLLEDISR